MGADKAGLDWGGATAVARVHALAVALGATPILTVGREVHGFPAVTGETPGGGPAEGVAEGARVLREAGCAHALVLAVDAPTVTPEDLAVLLDAAGSAAFDGLHLPCVIRLADLPRGSLAGWPMGRLLQALNAERPAPPPAAVSRLRGANTPDERAGLLATLAH
jgi:molybdopterin-guanine dinucleotide biosynthesis protein A